MGTEAYWNRPWHKNITFSPDDLRLKCCEYFDWALENPLYGAQLASHQGVNEIVKIPKVRIFHLAGLLAYVGIAKEDWTKLLQNADMAPVCSWALEIIRIQKFENAAVSLLNTPFVMRDLEMAETVRGKFEHSGAGGGALDLQLSLTELRELAEKQGLPTRIFMDDDDSTGEQPETPEDDQ